MFSSFKLAVAAVFAGMLATVMVSASPIIEQRAPTCKPNFEGNRQTIYHTSTVPSSVNVWRADSVHGGAVTLDAQAAATAFDHGEFLVPIGGVGAHSYEFKMVADTMHQFSLMGDGNTLAFRTGWSSALSFEIDCETCPTPGSGKTLGLRAVNCAIKQTNTNKCVTGGQSGQTLRLATCNNSSDQKYIFQSGN